MIPTCTPTGFVSIDDMIGGFPSGRLSMLVGPALSGKSIFMINLARNIIKSSPETQLAFFGGDLPARGRRGIIERVACSAVGADYADLLRKKLPRNKAAEVSGFCDKYAGASIYAPDGPALSAREVVVACEALKSATGLDMIFIDGVESIPDDNGQAGYTNLKTRLMEFKILAMETGIPVIAALRAPGPPDKPEFEMQEFILRERIESYADILLYFGQSYCIEDDVSADDKSIVSITVALNRTTLRVGYTRIRFYPDRQLFADI